MSQTHISSLPDITLLRIFRHIPLSDLLNSTGQVCARWLFLLPTEMSHRHSLVLPPDNHESLSSAPDYCLQHDFPMLKDIKKNDGSPMIQIEKYNMEKLKFDYVDLENVEHSTLGTVLRRITHLTVMFKHVSVETIEKITELLDSYWSETLISLTIDFEGLSSFDMSMDESCDCELFQLFMAINQLGSLEHLKLYLIGFSDIISQPMGSDFDLTIVSRLKTLCIQTDNYNPSWFFNSLKFVPNNDTRPMICFHDSADIRKFVALQSRSAHHQLTLHFTNISITNAVGSGMVRDICAGYSSLTTLSLKIEPFEMVSLPRELRRLQHLVTLKLTLGQTFDENPNENDNNELIDRQINAAELHQGWPILVKNPAPLEEDHQVHSIRLLHLELWTESHENIAALRIPEVFPNVQAISLSQCSFRCHICKYEPNEDEFDDFELIDDDDEVMKGKMDDKIEQCTRLARQALKGCVHLHTIQYCSNAFLETDLITISPQQL